MRRPAGSSKLALGAALASLATLVGAAPALAAGSLSISVSPTVVFGVEESTTVTLAGTTPPAAIDPTGPDNVELLVSVHTPSEGPCGADAEADAGLPALVLQEIAPSSTFSTPYAARFDHLGTELVCAWLEVMNSSGDHVTSYATAQAEVAVVAPHPTGTLSAPSRASRGERVQVTVTTPPLETDTHIGLALIRPHTGRACPRNTFPGNMVFTGARGQAFHRSLKTPRLAPAGTWVLCAYLSPSTAENPETESAFPPTILERRIRVGSAVGGHSGHRHHAHRHRRRHRRGPTQRRRRARSATAGTPA